MHAKHRKTNVVNVLVATGIASQPHMFNPSVTHGLPAGSQQSHCLKLILATTALTRTDTVCKTIPEMNCTQMPLAAG